MSRLQRFGFTIILMFISGCATHYTTLGEISLPKKDYPPAQDQSDLAFALSQPDIVVEMLSDKRATVPIEIKRVKRK
jgi:hypothetical protein